ncbi:MAG: YciI family protein [Deltaproteobacteria bacterium]|nr:MAG: YciI family protein [Deltaproteobacteria bacterium]
MDYMLLIYSDEKAWASMSEGQRSEIFGEYRAFTDAIVKSGHFKAGAPLQSTSTATTVRVKGGKTVTTDGPFAETREQLGGYYLVEARDLDEATAIAARIPGARYGSVEVRPVLPMTQPR